MKDARYLQAFEQPELQPVETEQPLTDHEKLMEAFRRLHDKCDRALERLRKRSQ